MREAMRSWNEQAAGVHPAQVGGGGTVDSSRVIQAIERYAYERPDAEAVGEVGGGGARCTYGELAAIVAARAQQLRSCVPPDRVVIAVVPSGIDAVGWLCASIAAGVRYLPMHTQVSRSEARAVTKRSSAVAVLGGEGLGLELPRLDEQRGEISATRQHHGGSASVAAIDPEPRDRGAGAVVLGSSGTTGLPKLALRDGASLDANAAGVCAGMGLTGTDRVLVTTPLSHSYGVDLQLGTLMAGAALRVVGQFDTEAVAGELMSGATVLPGVPFVFEALARCEPRRSGSLRLALSAGSPLPRRVREGFSEVWGVEIGQLYGATELGTVSMDLPGEQGFDGDSVGRPLAGVSMRVVDIDNPERVLGAGIEGQLAVRAASMLSGYLDGEVPLVDGHLLTGDLARISADGRVWITGRLKVLIDVGAYKVNPLEIEGVLSMHPDVAECVVVPVSASGTVQRIRAVVVGRDTDHPPTPEALRRYLRERLSPIKVPRVVDVVSSLPKSPTGKVLRDRV